MRAGTAGDDTESNPLFHAMPEGDSPGASFANGA